MNISSIRKIGIVAAVTALGLGTLAAAPYEHGLAVTAFQAKDQNDKPFTLRPTDTCILLVSHDMETGKMANAALSARGKEYLKAKKAVAVANIFGMPGKVSILTLSGGKVDSIAYWTPGAEAVDGYLK